MEFINNINPNQKIECFEKKYSDGNDMLHFIAKNAKIKKNIDILKKYIKLYPEKINVQNNKKFTPLMIARNFYNTTSSFECVQILLEYGAKI